MSEREFVAAAAALRDVEKKFVERNATLDQALLMRIADQRLDVLAIAFAQSILPRVDPKNLLLLLGWRLVLSDRKGS